MVSSIPWRLGRHVLRWLLRDYDLQKDRLEERIERAKRELVSLEHKIESAKKLVPNP
jgi:predicted  nucleic acid-binding Zn-ribbon protein